MVCPFLEKFGGMDGVGVSQTWANWVGALGYVNICTYKQSYPCFVFQSLPFLGDKRLKNNKIFDLPP
jgi:hypothetical protein